MLIICLQQIRLYFSHRLCLIVLLFFWKFLLSQYVIQIGGPIKLGTFSLLFRFRTTNDIIDSHSIENIIKLETGPACKQLILRVELLRLLQFVEELLDLLICHIAVLVRLNHLFIVVWIELGCLLLCLLESLCHPSEVVSRTAHTSMIQAISIHLMALDSLPLTRQEYISV